jgi:uncharacterized protein
VRKALITSLLFTVGLIGSASANIDCQRDRQPVERLICSDAGLLMQDNQMSSLYYQLRNFSNRRGAQRVLNDQRDWLAERGECESVRCLTRKYNDRIHELQDVLNSDE